MGESLRFPPQVSFSRGRRTSERSTLQGREMARIEIDTQKCKGCGFCVNFCPRNLAWITMWRIVEDIDPQTFLQNIEFQLEQQYQNFTVISRKQATINGVNVFIVIAESTSPQGQAQINGILVFYENNQAKLGVVSAGLRRQYDNLSPMLDQIIGSITLW